MAMWMARKMAVAVARAPCWGLFDEMADILKNDFFYSMFP
jgi:hypothetical protein